MKRTVAIIQARIGSTRLPGKVMLSLHGCPVIEWVVRRTSAARGLDDEVVAIPDTPVDDILYDFLSNTLQANVFRGSEQDVLSRFVTAARACVRRMTLQVLRSPFGPLTVTARILRQVTTALLRMARR